MPDAANTTLTVNEFISRKQPFVLEARVKHASAQSEHLGALAALRRQVEAIRSIDPAWVCTPEYRPEVGSYKLHCRRIGREKTVEIVGSLAAGIIMGTLAGALTSR